MQLVISTDEVCRILNICPADWRSLRRVLRPPLVVVRRRAPGSGRGRDADRLLLDPLLEWGCAIGLIDHETAERLAKLSTPLD